MRVNLLSPGDVEEKKVAGIIREILEKNDPEKFSEIVRLYQDRLFSLAMMLVQSEEDAQDIVANTFVAAYQNLKKFRHQSRFFTYLYRICKNFCWEYFREKKSQPTVSLDEKATEDDSGRITTHLEHLAAEDRQDELDIKETVWRAIKALPGCFRETIILKEIYGFNYQEIAVILNCSPMTVLTRLHRARKKLRRELQAGFRDSLLRKNVIEKSIALNGTKI